MAKLPIRELQQAFIVHALYHGQLRLGTVYDVTIGTRRKGSVIVVGLEERDDVKAP